jgi:hypothetical protein
MLSSVYRMATKVLVPFLKERFMPSEETFEETVIRLLESILQRLTNIERQLSDPENPQDYGEPS